MKQNAYSEIFADARKKRPLVYHITNYVTVNDCANITLCAGGAPVMADAPEEVEEMAGIADVLVLNIGTLNPGLIDAMILAGSMANERKIPVILDPVGAGATRLRTQSALKILDEIKVTVLKGNAGEISVLAGAGGEVRGVDSHRSGGDPVTVARDLARLRGIVVSVSGQTDIVTDGTNTLLIDNGHAMMGSISGTGCMVASVIGTFNGISHKPTVATTAAFAAFGIAGERAAAVANGPMSFKTALFDHLAEMDPETLSTCAKISKA